ncbi:MULTISPECIES: MFS transporter [unclassified Pseudomonas]|uniref:MFS transporter n=1 Tax=unclassified Pseudomonas TaxID=196821 RepID=UPI00177B342A|nr:MULTISPECIES: MFS transporter [unclassified Pseudomonas]MBD8621837.1 MFS transporter [Pseudomonas sp. CFBP 13727]MBD8827856.1 MFS transporter [Pseudomonas sp. CFBP 13602]
MNAGRNLVAAAFALTALSYGLARFAYGLLLPQMRVELSLDATAAGWIGSGAFAAYCAGIVLTFVLNGTFTPRTLAVLAGLAATVGMACIVVASSGWMLGAGVALAGLSTGLTSPPLASAVAARFNAAGRAKANAAINAGTAAGIVFSGAAAAMTVDAWRELYALFALIGAAITVWLWRALPQGGGSDTGAGMSLKLIGRPGLALLCLSAFAMGLSSTAIWTFGADILRGAFGVSDSGIAWAWIVLGAAGVSGAATGVLIDRFGTAVIHGGSLLAIVTAILTLAASEFSIAYGFVAMGLFGAAYIMSSGAYLIQGTALLPDRPDLGLGFPFLCLALGQTAGAPLFGAAMGAMGVTAALFAFALPAFLAIFLRPKTR